MTLVKLTPVAGLVHGLGGVGGDTQPPDTSGITLTNEPKVIDENYTTAIGIWNIEKESYGLDLGTPQTVAQFKMWDTAVVSGALTGGGIIIMGGDDNDNWVQVGDTLEWDSSGLERVNDEAILITPTEQASYRYWRIYNNGFGNISAAATSLIFTELEAYEEVEPGPPPSPGPGIWNFQAQAAGSASGVLLSWQAGYGYSGSTENCKITIQYSTDGAPHQIPNTPPYVVRDLVQQQGVNNVLWHPNTVHVNHYYSAWIYYEDSNRWVGPFNPTPSVTLPAVSGSVEPFTSGSLSFSKVDTNTKLSTRQDIIIDVLVWLPEGQDIRATSIEAALQSVAPSHTKLNVMYERYYIAQTTTEHFNGSSFDSNVHEVRNGTIINKTPTIDSSYSGNANILGGS